MSREYSTTTLTSQAIAVALGLFPIGLLFGVVAQQNYWNWTDVLFLSMLGFSASGQFFYVKLSSEQASMASIFFVVLMLNIRYIPMSLAAWNPSDKGKRLFRVVLSHFISDESFAIEPKTGAFPIRIRIRLIIYAAWVLSTVLGVVVSKLMPAEWITSSSQYLLFPATAILAILAAKRIDAAIVTYVSRSRSVKLMQILLCSLISAGMMYMAGPEMFWVPGILMVIATLHICGWGEER